MESQTPNGQAFPEYYSETTSSTPYASAPSSPGRPPRPGPGFINGGFFYSAPASPMHFALTPSLGSSMVSTTQPSSPDFEFSARFGSSAPGQTGSMSSADELFLNGKIRPMKLSAHLERPQVLAPLLEDDGEEDLRGRDRRSSSSRRKTRSMSPLRTNTNEDLGGKTDHNKAGRRSSKRWVFLKDFLRTKSEGRSNANSNYYKLWSTISFSPAKEKKPKAGGGESKKKKKKPVNGIGKRRVPPSPHELLYTANRAQAEELKKKTFLPYRQGLLGCLGFSSKGYSAMNGLARALNQVN